ncbi:MAG: HD domain-containing protein [Candidatus Saccharimonadales bacterium]
MSMEKTNIKLQPNGFYYEVPLLPEYLSRGARVAITMGSLASRLAQEERTRVHHPDGRAENVAEHSFMLAKVSLSLFRTMKEYLPTDLDERGILIAAIGHDDPEAFILDTATDRITEEGRRQKAIREVKGTTQLAIEFEGIDPEYAAAVVHYEKQLNANDRYVRMVDKLMTILIHLYDDGDSLKTHFSKTEIIENAREHSVRFRQEYPDFEVISDLRDELVDFALDTYYPEA